MKTETVNLAARHIRVIILLMVLLLMLTMAATGEVAAAPWDQGCGIAQLHAPREISCGPP